MKTKGHIALWFAFIFALILTVLWQIFLADKTSYYLVSVIVLFLSMLPFFFKYEKTNKGAREVSLIAILISLAVVSRAVFYLIPQVKPIAAVVIISAVCLGAERGYIIGAFSAFISNFIFGQGIWTPFQMVALGLVGFASALIFKVIKPNKWSLAIVGFVLTFALYGVIVDTSSVLTMVSQYSFSSVIAVYIAGMPFSAVFGATTAVFLFLFGMPFKKKIDRINNKYGIIAVDDENI